MQKFIKLVLLGLMISGCQTAPKVPVSPKPDDLILREDESINPPPSLTAEQVRWDISLVIYALKQGYGGRKYVPGTLLQNALGNLIKIDSAMTPEELRDRIDTVLWMIPDSHLMARLNKQPSAFRKKILTSGSVVGPNAIRDSSKKWEVRVDRIRGKKILYISITTFPSARDPIWNGFIETARLQLKESSLMVLDLRGNGGGDDAKGYELAEMAFGGKFNHPVNREYFSQTPETFILAANGPLFSAKYLKSQGKEVPAYFAELSQEAMVKYKMASEGKLPSERIVTTEQKDFKFNPRKGYDKPIFILMDGGCGSSCESTIDAFESNPRVKKVGRNTIGMIQFGNEGALVLPNSKVHVQMATKYNEYNDKRFLEKSGIKPDVEVPEGQDAYLFTQQKLIK